MTDIEIARKAKLEPITKVTDKLGIPTEYVSCYGNKKAKIDNAFYSKIKENEDAKLILVTAINPTPLGEGKTTISIGLADRTN